MYCLPLSLYIYIYIYTHTYVVTWLLEFNMAISRIRKKLHL